MKTPLSLPNSPFKQQTPTHRKPQSLDLKTVFRVFEEAFEAVQDTPGATGFLSVDVLSFHRNCSWVVIEQKLHFWFPASVNLFRKTIVPKKTLAEPVASNFFNSHQWHPAEIPEITDPIANGISR